MKNNVNKKIITRESTLYCNAPSDNYFQPNISTKITQCENLGDVKSSKSELSFYLMLEIDTSYSLLQISLHCKIFGSV